MKKIIFRNQKTSLIIGSEITKITVIPIVLTDGQSTGVGILREDGNISWWNLLSPCDIIAYWRATELIRNLSEIEGNTLYCAYCAAGRRICDSDKKQTKKIVNIIGEKTYEKIMTLPIPEEIIQYILNNQNKDGWGSPSLWPIVDEYHAGTLEWREEFTKLGLSQKDPFVIQQPSKRNFLKKLINSLFR